MIRSEINDGIYIKSEQPKGPGQGIFFRDTMIQSEINDVIYIKSKQAERSWASYIFS